MEKIINYLKESGLGYWIEDSSDAYSEEFDSMYRGYLYTIDINGYLIHSPIQSVSKICISNDKHRIDYDMQKIFAKCIKERIIHLLKKSNFPYKRIEKNVSPTIMMRKMTKYSNKGFTCETAIDKIVEEYKKEETHTIIRLTKDNNKYKLQLVNVLCEISETPFDDIYDVIYYPKSMAQGLSEMAEVYFSYRIDQDISELKKFISKNRKTIMEAAYSSLYRKLHTDYGENAVSIYKPVQITIKKTTNQVMVQFETKN